MRAAPTVPEHHTEVLPMTCVACATVITRLVRLWLTPVVSWAGITVRVLTALGYQAAGLCMTPAEFATAIIVRAIRVQMACTGPLVCQYALVVLVPCSALDMDPVTMASLETGLAHVRQTGTSL
jgi:hypothetical protein